MACGLLDEDEDSGLTVPSQGIYILCEGNYTGGNASLWWISPDFTTSIPDVYTGLTDQPLGDTGQSLLVDGDRLYVVVNGSSTLEVFDLAGENLEFEHRLDLNGAGPRELAVSGTTGYLTCWNLAGILVIDLVTWAIEDTIPVAGKTEDIIVVGDYLYVAVPSNIDFTNATSVLKLALDDGSLVATYDVGPGPQQLLLDGDVLYVARQWYDYEYNSYQGLARIDLTTAEVFSVDIGAGSGVDLFNLAGHNYIATSNGVTQFTGDLEVATGGRIGGGLQNIYSAGTDGVNCLIGTADFTGPGEVHAFTPEGTELASFITGVGPGAFASYSR
ncbi:MAG: DUF5074 domain-containing protein [Candidatus Neomarinimicrobiota bacterium]